MTTTTRTQLTLFVPQEQAAELEAVRRPLDPVQFGLIAAHVTLCREDEFDAGLLALPASGPLTLHFGAPERFSGHGVLLPCVAGEEEFQALRQRILGSKKTIRRQAPHITLAHPRNPRAPGNEMVNAARLAAGLSITFTSICRIEQVDSGVWNVRDRFPLL